MRLLLLALLLLVGCTDAGLQPVPPPPPEVLDDKLAIRGEVCTEPADVTPFPVKILFLVDQSASLQCTDSRNRRFEALNRVVASLSPLPNVWFGFVGFASWSRKLPFTQDAGAWRPFLDPGQGLGPATDYQGALASAVQLLEQDMIEVGPAVRARSRYVVVFVSDGAPEPRCRGGCEDDARACEDGVDNDGDGLSDGSDPDCEGVGDNALRPDNLYPVCNTDLEIPEESYVDMTGRCPEYNMPRQILQRIDDLRALERVYSAGDVQLNTVLLTSPQEVIEGICPNASAAFGYNAEQARVLLEAMAAQGGGTFRDVNVDAGDDSFLDFDFTSLRAPYFVTAFAARNANARPWLATDTDGDGLEDAREEELGTDPRSPDSDGDGYADAFEARFADDGFDPLDAAVPARPCASAGDADGDGLRDCEESFVGTGERIPDSDGDRLLDGDEVQSGTDPLRADARDDPDFDGRPSAEELRAGTDPLRDDRARFAEAARHALTDRGERPVPDRETGDEVQRHCYDFEVRDLRLVVTEQLRDRGRNRIYLDAFGEPQGVAGSRAAVRRACVEALFPGEGKKAPASGEVDLGAGTWRRARERLEVGYRGVAECLGLDPLALDRRHLEDVLDGCLPDRVPLERTLYEREELRALLERWIDRNLAAKLPADPSDVFWPIEVFDPEAHCFRPWELERVLLLLDALGDACSSCEGFGVGDAGLDGGGDAE